MKHSEKRDQGLFPLGFRITVPLERLPSLHTLWVTLLSRVLSSLFRLAGKRKSTESHRDFPILWGCTWGGPALSINIFLQPLSTSNYSHSFPARPSWGFWFGVSSILRFKKNKIKHRKAVWVGQEQRKTGGSSKVPPGLGISLPFSPAGSSLIPKLSP